jgi:hypothetical protein
MRGIKALIFGGLLIGSLAAFALPASASTTDVQPSWCQDVVTPPIQNLTYVWNDTGVTVTVNLYGNFYWVQTKPDPTGKTTYLGPTTETLTLTPGAGVSLAWHPNTGGHEWIWNGTVSCVPPVTHVTKPCRPRYVPPCRPVTIRYIQPQRPCYGHDRDWRYTSYR